MMKNWGVIGGIAAAMAAGVYVLWGPISDRKKKRKGLFSLWLKVLKEVKVTELKIDHFLWNIAVYFK